MPSSNAAGSPAGRSVVAGARFFAVALGIILATSQPSRAWNSPAPDVVLYCVPALDRVLHDIASHYTVKTGIPVHIFVSPPDGIIGLLKHRARGDVVVADAATIEGAGAAGLLLQDKLIPLGANGFVLIARAHTGSTLAPTGNAAGLLATTPVELPDPTTAASFDGAAVLHTAFPDAHFAGLNGVSDTPTVIADVRSGAAPLGLVHASEANEAGLATVASVPATPPPLEGALVKLGQSANANRLLDFIAGPDGRAALREAGVEETQ